MKKIEFKIADDFISFLRTNIANPQIKSLIPMIDHFVGINAGCNCQKANRIKIFKEYYESKINAITINEINEIKNISQVEKIIFYKDGTEEILKEF